jgi:hypothetical protein
LSRTDGPMPLIQRIAAVIYGTDDVSAQELADKDCHESHYHLDAGPHGRNPHSVRDFPRRSHYICGLLQSTEHDPGDCVAMEHDAFLAFAHGADQMNEWHALCRRMGCFGRSRYACARAGYGPGFAAAKLACRRGDNS